MKTVLKNGFQLQLKKKKGIFPLLYLPICRSQSKEGRSSKRENSILQEHLHFPSFWSFPLYYYPLLWWRYKSLTSKTGMNTKWQQSHTDKYNSFVPSPDHPYFCNLSLEVISFHKSLSLSLILRYNTSVCIIYFETDLFKCTCDSVFLTSLP